MLQTVRTGQERKSPSQKIQVKRHIPTPCQVRDLAETSTERVKRKITAFLSTHDPYITETKRFQHDISRILAALADTDDGNALRLVARYGHLFRYVKEQKSFVVWNGKQWKEDGTGYVLELAKRTVRHIEIEADLIPLPTDGQGDLAMLPALTLLDNATPEQQAIIEQFEAREKRVNALRAWSKKSQSRRSLESMIELAKSEAGITILQIDLDAQDDLVNFQNGTLHAPSGEFRKHNPADLLTKIIPYEYDAGAKGPHWSSFISKVTRGNKDTQRTLQQLVGTGIVGKQLDDILAVCYGGGGNGKTVFSEALKEALGNYADTAEASLFLAKQSEGVSNDRAALVGVRFLTTSETDDGRRLNEALVKSMTGGDRQKVRFLHKEFFDLVPKFTAVLFTNHKPIIVGTDKGIWRRVKLIPWLYDFEKDPQRKPKPEVMAELQRELPGIFNWAYQGYRDRMTMTDLFISQEIQAATKEYRDQSDTLGQFLQDNCILTEEGAKVLKSALYEKYREFSEAEGVSNITTKKNLGTKLMERGDIPNLREWKDGQGNRYWVGIRLRTEFDKVEEPPASTSDQGQDVKPPSIEEARARKLLEQFERGKSKGYLLQLRPDGADGLEYDFSPDCSEEKRAALLSQIEDLNVFIIQELKTRKALAARPDDMPPADEKGRFIYE